MMRAVLPRREKLQRELLGNGMGGLARWTIAKWVYLPACARTAWRRIRLRDGEKGELEAQYLHASVWVWDGSEKQAQRWHWLVRREFGASEISHYCLSNASLETPPQKLAQIQAQRFFIEHNFHEAKSECGMADYQVRRWDAWHHHMALVMLATLFLRLLHNHPCHCNNQLK